MVALLFCMRIMNTIFRITKQTHTYKEESIMTRDEFLNMNWSDSQTYAKGEKKYVVNIILY